MSPTPTSKPALELKHAPRPNSLQADEVPDEFIRRLKSALIDRPQDGAASDNITQKFLKDCLP